MWAISIVELTVPTEKVIGAFPTAQEAADFVEYAHLSGRAKREQWQQVTILPMQDPDGAE